MPVLGKGQDILDAWHSWRMKASNILRPSSFTVAPTLQINENINNASIEVIISAINNSDGGSFPSTTTYGLK